MSDSKIPDDVQADIEAGISAVQQEMESVDAVDPHYNSIVQTLEDVQKQIEEERSKADGYIFDRAEFEAALPFIISDQQSALRKDKLTHKEWADRFNRWFTFCDAVANLGITCVKNKAALEKEDWEAVFSSLKLNKQFEDTFLKKHKLRIAMDYKSGTIKEKYKWLAMPVLLVTDDAGVEHKIAISPSPFARVWWLEILIGFHSQYQWKSEQEIEQQDFDEAPYEQYGDVPGRVVH
jgi:hypothetical protein